MKARWLAALLLSVLVLVLVAHIMPARPPAATAVQTARPRPVSRPVLSFGSRGAAVRRAQSLLNRQG
ncbi:MAG: hypothetical protein ACJ74K_18475 [Actinomycetes bacterium]